MSYQGPKASDAPKAGGILPRGWQDSYQEENECCFSFACTAATRGNQGCIPCKHTSKLPSMTVSFIQSRARREYVKLLRVFVQGNPGKSLN